MGGCQSAAPVGAPGTPGAQSAAGPESPRPQSLGGSAPVVVSGGDDAVCAFRDHAEAGRLKDALRLLRDDPRLLSKIMLVPLHQKLVLELLEEQLKHTAILEEDVAALRTQNAQLRLQQELDCLQSASERTSGELQPIPVNRDLWTGSTDLSDVFDIDDICRPFQWGTEADEESSAPYLMRKRTCKEEIEAEEAEAKARYDSIVQRCGGSEGLRQGAAFVEEALCTRQVSDFSRSQASDVSRSPTWQGQVPDTLQASTPVAQVAGSLDCAFVKQDPIFNCMSYSRMCKAALPVKEEFDRIVSAIAERLRTQGAADVITTGLKGKERGEVKVGVDFAGDWSKLTDMVRATLKVEGRISNLYSVLAEVLRSPERLSSVVSVEEVKDRYQKPMPSGYRDISVMLRVHGMICELQLNLVEVLEVKESPLGCAVYEKTRKVTDSLLWSAMQGDIMGIRAALHDGADPNACDGQFGISTLSFVAVTGDAEAVATLLKARADPLQPDSLGILPLHRAVRGRFEDAAKKLVESMTQRPAGAENVKPVAATRFAECLGLVVDIGWTEVAVVLYAWWAEAEAPPVIARWLELRWLTTIRAAGKFLPGLLCGGGPRALLRAVEFAPEVLELMLDSGADASAQVPVEVPEHIGLVIDGAPACETSTVLMATDLAQAFGDDSAVKLLESRGAVVRKIGVHMRGSSAAAFGTEPLPQILLAASSLGLGGNGSAMSSATSLQIASMKALKELSISGYSIGPLELLSIAQCASLQSLNLSDSCIGAEVGAKQLSNALRVNNSILTLNLCNNGIGLVGCKALAEALAISSGLRTLNLYNNGVGTEGCVALAEALCVNSSLRTLNLGSNSIGAEGGRALARALHVNNHLKSLNLRYNAISADGGRALAAALQVNRSLEALDVRNNAIGQEGGKALNSAMQVNSTLRKVEMSNYTAIQGRSDSIERGSPQLKARGTTQQQHQRLRAVLKVTQPGP